MSSEIFRISHVSKYFEIYAKPYHRLLQMLFHGRRTFYREFWALRDIDIKVNKGECLGIIGRNGAGKSTLLQIIAGTLAPSSGTVECHGRVAALLELGSGFNPEFTGRENVHLNAAILGLTEQEIADRFDSIAAFADIGDFIDQPVKTYSSGMMLRLAFAVMAHVDAEVLIIDEALAVGDAFFTQKCMRFLRHFIEEHTVVFVSHDAAAVRSLCSRAIMLEKGQLVMDGSPKEVTEKYLEELYVEQQGENAPKSSSLTEEFDIPESEYRDMRLDLLNASPFRNDIQIFRFNPNADSFGKGGAVINKVWMTDSQDRPLHWVVGGEQVRLCVHATAKQQIVSPIVGFFVNNQYGQQLFGDNTFLSYQDHPLTLAANESFCARFGFVMPIMPSGEYTVTVALAEGTQQEHLQHQWMHDALVFSSQATSASAGLIGIPMQKIVLEKVAH